MFDCAKLLLKIKDPLSVAVESVVKRVLNVAHFDRRREDRDSMNVLGG